MTGAVVWFTGLPSSGKTTLAHAVERRLASVGVCHCVLDGDVMRPILAPRLGYTSEDRAEFYAGLARLAAELARQGLVVLVPATANLREYRRWPRQLAPHFLEVWLTTTLAECQTRDTKGLYASAAREPGHLPGIDVRYEEPEHAEVLAAGGDDLAAVERILGFLRRVAEPATEPRMRGGPA
jgi:adenylylsulfate kinase